VVDARSIFRSVVVGGGVYTDIRHCNPHVRGGVVSEHAARIVVKDLPDNAVPLARIHQVHFVMDDVSARALDNCVFCLRCVYTRLVWLLEVSEWWS
jgi:hypothetical protein